MTKLLSFYGRVVFYLLYSPINRHLGCFYISWQLQIMHVMNIGVHVCFQISVFVFYGYAPRVELDHTVVLFLVF